MGPIRSGRLTYNQIGGPFPNSCLVYASAAWDIGEMLDACEIVFGVDKTTPNSALLPVTRLGVSWRRRISTPGSRSIIQETFLPMLFPREGSLPMIFTFFTMLIHNLPGSTTQFPAHICAGPISPMAQALSSQP